MRNYVYYTYLCDVSLPKFLKNIFALKKKVINDCAKGGDDSNGLRKVMFTNNITCNDGTPAG